jgi:hypothetical protein
MFPGSCSVRIVRIQIEDPKSRREVQIGPVQCESVCACVGELKLGLGHHSPLGPVTLRLRMPLSVVTLTRPIPESEIARQLLGCRSRKVSDKQLRCCYFYIRVHL